MVVFGFAIICYTLLAPWQFDRHSERQERNDAVQASYDEQPQPLSEVLPSERPPGSETEWQRVSIEGTYLPEAETLARLRTVHGEPAFEVLTPVRTIEGENVLVNRGYVRLDDHGNAEPYPSPPEGTVRVQARVRSEETDPQDREAIADDATDGRPHVHAINSGTINQTTDLDIRPGYFQLTEEQPGEVNALPLPHLEAGPFFSYALQWVAFGSMAILGWLYFTLRELRPGGALDTERPIRQRRQSVAEILAEDEEEEMAHPS